MLQIWNLNCEKLLKNILALERYMDVILESKKQYDNDI
jgi:hypothetical protein